MYTNSGARNAAHDDVTSITSVSAPSYVNVQVFAPIYGSKYHSVTCQDLHTATFVRIARTHIVMSLARDSESISTEELAGGGHPIYHITLGQWSTSIMRYLVQHTGNITVAVQELVDSLRVEREAAKNG